MIEENSKQHWLKIATIALVTFLMAFLAFYIVMEMMVKRINSPAYARKQIEREIHRQEQDFEKFEKNFNENPFTPTMRPMLVNLVKEPNEYKIIVDLKPLDGDENNINIQINDNELTIKGEMDKKIRGTEKMISFTQTYYLDEKLEQEKITKEKKGDKYIITIPIDD